MLKLIIGTDWIANRKKILSEIAADVSLCKENRILLVPELISHDMERRLCLAAGDAASRFAEVLSFTRLSRRVADASGHGSVPYLDEGGRVVAMAAAVMQVQSKLKFFASVGTKPEFMTGLVETVDECKRCCVYPSSLMRASKETSGVLAQKLEELAFIFEAYDGICLHGKKDPSDQLTWLLEELECTDYAEKHVFYIDGFSDFTRQQMEILSHLIKCSPQVVVSMTCDKPKTEKVVFERPGETLAQLCRIAERLGVDIQIEEVFPINDRTLPIANALFEGHLPALREDCLQVIRCDTVYRECEAIAERIMQLVQNGCRYRDISIVCPDMAGYEGPLNMILQRCGIPAYLSGTQNILDRPVIATVVSALDAALSCFELKAVLSYLKTALSPLSLQECDLIENYALLWGISGKKWMQKWQLHPKGLVDVWSDTDRELLSELNDLREKVIAPLVILRDCLLHADRVSDMVVALYDFLETISLAQRLSALADHLAMSADLKNAQILDQLWEVLVNALEQMHDVLGDGLWDPDAFSRLFRILLSQYDVGTIPTVLDAVTVGPINAMRDHETQHLFIPGAVEGMLPSYGSATGLLTDQDRSILRDLGVTLNGGAVESLQTLFSEIYSVFSGALQSVWVSCPSGQPSYVYQRLSEMVNGEQLLEHTLGAAISNNKHAAAYLLRTNTRDAASALNVEHEYDAIAKKRTHVHGYVSKERIEKIYGNQFRLSASQIDLHANCAMSYFLKYGLRAKERKAAEIDPAEFGTFVHDVLEKTARKIADQGGFKVVTKEDALRMAEMFAKEYTDAHFAGLDSQRLSYLHRRNGKELALIVEELWNELNNSEFSPAMFELSFGGDDGGFPAIQIQGSTVLAKLRGFVDRVDIWNSGDKAYFRVVDYKTGIKTFDYCDIVNGIGLQMLLYLFALEQADSDLLGKDPVASGVQYFPARAPVVSVENSLDEHEAEKAREQCWKRSGLLLGEDAVLTAMASEDMASRMPYKRKKDGTLSGDIADRSQFAMLKEYIYRYLQRMVDDIASGNVTANPYTRDARKNACRFCPYGEICHKAEVPGRRVFKAINAQRFWDDVAKEVNQHG